ncbi:MAG: hypothetical protein E6J26_11085 [Chloroflexi bacterium]|nr:MAG: hypothetical protein E6J26_11085 [Chloroflexota bacterium]
MDQWLYSLGNQLAFYLPRVLGAIVLIVLAFIVASIVKWVLNRLLTGARLDERYGRHVATGGKPFSVSSTISNTAFWLVILFFLPAILDQLALPGLLTPVQSMINRIFLFLPNLLAAAVIFAVGWFVATVVKRVLTGVLAAVGVDRAWDHRVPDHPDSGADRGCRRARHPGDHAAGHHDAEHHPECAAERLRRLHHAGHCVRGGQSHRRTGHRPADGDGLQHADGADGLRARARAVDDHEHHDNHARHCAYSARDEPDDAGARGRYGRARGDHALHRRRSDAAARLHGRGCHAGGRADAGGSSGVGADHLRRRTLPVEPCVQRHRRQRVRTG